MQKDYNIREGQSLADIAIQLGGEISHIIELMKLNNVSADASLSGTAIKYDDASVVNKQVASYYDKNKITPATQGTAVVEGIGYWAIEQDFIIS